MNRIALLTQIVLPLTREALGPPEPPEPREPLHPVAAATAPLEFVLPPALKLDFVRHPRARRYVVRVRADGSVRVTIPRWGSKREAEAFAREQQAWIHKQLARVGEQRRDPEDTLSASEAKELRRAAERILPARLFELAGEFGLQVSRVSVRNQRWRWGSCSPGGRISLNWRLVRMPDAVRDYVIIHELMHMKRMDHSPAFWALVAAACPGYQSARRWLRDHQASLS